MTAKEERNKYYKEMRTLARKQPPELQKEFITEAMKLYAMKTKGIAQELKAKKEKDKEEAEAKKFVHQRLKEAAANVPIPVEKLFESLPLDEIPA